MLGDFAYAEFVLDNPRARNRGRRRARKLDRVGSRHEYASTPCRRSRSRPVALGQLFSQSRTPAATSRCLVFRRTRIPCPSPDPGTIPSPNPAWRCSATKQTASGTIRMSKSLKTIVHVNARARNGAFQPTQTQDVTTISGQRITQALGNATSRNEQNLILAAPGAMLDSQGNITVRGSLNVELGYQYDGVNFTIPFFDGNGGGGAKRHRRLPEQPRGRFGRLAASRLRFRRRDPGQHRRRRDQHRSAARNLPCVGNVQHGSRFAVLRSQIRRELRMGHAEQPASATTSRTTARVTFRSTRRSASTRRRSASTMDLLHQPNRPRRPSEQLRVSLRPQQQYVRCSG